MKKELITVDNLDSLVCIQDGKAYIGQGRMLTPGAKDELYHRRLEIVYGDAPVQSKGACCGSCATGRTFYVGPEASPLGSAGSLESLTAMVAGMLRREYGVTDEKECRKLTLEALKTMKNNV